jgi:hypothetical protein
LGSKKAVRQTKLKEQKQRGRGGSLRRSLLARSPPREQVERRKQAIGRSRGGRLAESLVERKKS